MAKMFVLMMCPVGIAVALLMRYARARRRAVMRPSGC